MKKKIVAMCATVALAAVAVGGTLAYFTDTDTATNTFTWGDVKIELNEKFAPNVDTDNDGTADAALLVPGSKTENYVEKSVTVKNVGSEDAYMWIEVWVPASLDDGDDNSPAAPGLGNSLHFNYGKGVTETKATFLGTKDGYNGYVHYVANGDAIAKDGSTVALLDQVYMDSKVSQCANGEENCIVLVDGTHYDGSWEIVINAVGFQADGFTMEEAITEYYGKNVSEYIW